MDVLYSLIDRGNKWYRSGWTTDFENNPLIDDIKRDLTPGWLDACTGYDGKVNQLPYANQFTVFFRNMKILNQTSFKDVVQFKSYEDLLSACVEIKKQGLSEYPYLPAWHTRNPEAGICGACATVRGCRCLSEDIRPVFDVNTYNACS